MADNVALVVVCVLLVGAVGGYLTYTTHVAPGTATEMRQTASWESSGAFTHRATVVNGSRAFEAGTVLRNRTVYFQRVTPRLNGSFAYTYAASDGGDVDAETTVSLVFRSVDTADDGDPTVYWRVDRTLNRASEQSLAAGERTTVPFSVNVSEAAAEAARIDERIGGTPGTVEVAVVARTTLSGTRNGRSVDATRTYRLPMTSEGNVYRVEDPGAVTASGGQTERVTVPAEYGSLRRVGGPALLAVALGALAGLGHARRTGWLTVTDAERRWLAYRSAREEFDEWITTGRVPPEVGAPAVVDVDSLAGLVDVAIDTDDRVVEDERRNACLVLGDDHWYRYDVPTDPTTEERDALTEAEAATNGDSPPDATARDVDLTADDESD